MFTKLMRMMAVTISILAGHLAMSATVQAQSPAPAAPAPGQAQSPAAAPAAPAAPAAAAKPAYWGGIAFTADGSYATAWKQPSKAEAEADVAKRCAKMGRGECEVIGFRGELCVALATYQGAHSGRRYKLSFSGGGTTSPDAQKTALDRCNEDKRTRGRCQLRTVVCGDGR